jgi:hypothetical protein
LKGEFVCRPVWGEAPSAELRLPGGLLGLQPVAPTRLAAVGASTPGSAAVPPLGSGGADHDTWYGFYPNGREVLIAIEAVHGRDLTAIYAIGPGIDENEPAEWSRRKGHIVGRKLVFAQDGDSTLRFRARYDGGLSATWISPDGKTTMNATLRRIDPFSLPTRAAAR